MPDTTTFAGNMVVLREETERITTYLAGLQCAKRLWLEMHRPFLAAPPSETERFRLARQIF